MTPDVAPKNWRGRFYEDIDVGDVFISRIGRTIIDADNVWFTCMTMNTNQVHFNHVSSTTGLKQQPLVNSTLTLALVTGLSVADTSENAAANLGWESVTLPKPVLVGDTLWARSEVTACRESSSRPEVGIVSVHTEGINQRGEVVIDFKRTFMIWKRTSKYGRNPSGFPGAEPPTGST